MVGRCPAACLADTNTFCVYKLLAYRVYPLVLVANGPILSTFAAVARWPPQTWLLPKRQQHVSNSVFFSIQFLCQATGSATKTKTPPPLSISLVLFVLNLYTLSVFIALCCMSACLPPITLAADVCSVSVPEGECGGSARRSVD